jgi:hypothetical protein
MIPLPADASDADLIAFADRWAALLERGDYGVALALINQTPPHGWTATEIREAVERHGKRVTLDGVTTEDRPPQPDGSCGEIWYDLYVDGRQSDLTAVFYLKPTDGGMTLQLVDIGVR